MTERTDPSAPLAPTAAMTRSFEEFFGEGHMVSSVFSFDGRDDDHEVFWRTPCAADPYAVLAGGYVIHVGNDPDWEPSTAILSKDGARCGFYGGGQLWVDPEHRGRSLGAELVLAMTEVLGSCPSQVEGGMGFSPSGLAAHRKAWELARARTPIPPLTPATIARAIREVTNALLENGVHPLAINDGLCEDVAVEALEHLGRDECDEIQMIEVANLAEDGEGPFDQKLLAEHWPACIPPAPLGWDDLDEFGLSDSTHIMLVAEGRFYDADAPEGVDNIFDLPLMRRNLAAGIRRVRPELEKDLVTFPWFAETFALHDELVAWRRTLDIEAGEPQATNQFGY